MSNEARIIREKETFRTETIVNLDGQDVKFYTKSSVNYERLSYKVQPIITMVHGDSQDVDNALLEAKRQCIAECKTRLAQYREETGIGTQGDLFDYGALGEPSPGE